MSPIHSQPHEFQTWPIVRTRPSQKAYGKSISVFISNPGCNLTTVDVYEDGVVDAWELLDLPAFKAKLQKQWVIPAPKDETQIIRVHHFGTTGFRHGDWWQSPASIFNQAEAIILSLNPCLTGLADVEAITGTFERTALGILVVPCDKKPYRMIKPDADEILGSVFPILRRFSDSFELTQLFLFSDGQAQIGPGGELFPLDQMPFKFDCGEITNTAPKGSRVIFPGLGSIETTQDFGIVTDKDRIGELTDKLRTMNGLTSIVTMTGLAFGEYENNPSPENKEALRKLYESVPAHLRLYCGDMDTRDYKIQEVLYGKDFWRRSTFRG